MSYLCGINHLNPHPMETPIYPPTPKPRPTTVYRRRCSVTGEGMNSGWLFEDDHDTIKYEKDVVHVIKECAPNYDLEVEGRSDDDILQAAFELDICYWTEWEDDIEDGDECYTLHGVPLRTEADRAAYLAGQPCTDEERAACYLSWQGYHVWVGDIRKIHADTDRHEWTGVQRVSLGNVWNHDLTDSIGVDIADSEVEFYNERYHEAWRRSADGLRDEAMDPSNWRFLGWQEIYTPNPPQS